MYKRAGERISVRGSHGGIRAEKATRPACLTRVWSRTANWKVPRPWRQAGSMTSWADKSDPVTEPETDSSGKWPAAQPER